MLDYCKKIYEGFVETDDQHIMKMFRRIFIIHQFQIKLRKSLLFLRWRDLSIRNYITHKKTFPINSSLRNFYNIPQKSLTSLSKRNIKISRNRSVNTNSKSSISSISYEVVLSHI